MGNIIKNRFTILGNLEEPIGLAWSGYFEDRSVNGAIGMTNAQNVNDFLKYASMLDGSCEAIAFATMDNHIGFLVSGKVPIRENIESSTFFRDGTNKKEDWTGFIPEHEMPRSIDPESGYIVACNNLISPSSIKGKVGTAGTVTVRSVRANELIKSYIENKIPIDENTIFSMQMDTTDLFAKNIIPELINLAELYFSEFIQEFPKNSDMPDNLRKLIRILKNWDYKMSAESSGALINQVWTSELKKMLMHKYFPDLNQRTQITNMYHFVHFLGKLIKSWSKNEDLNSAYCTNLLNNGKIPKCIHNILYALSNTYTKIAQNIGNNEVFFRKI